MKLRITKLTPIYRSPEDNGIFLQWDVLEPPSASFTFLIERSVGPLGPYETVISGINTSHFFDNLRAVPFPATGETRENLNHLSLVRTLHYRVTATASTGETASVVRELDNNLPKRQLLLQRKMQRDLALTFKFNGVNVYVLKRLHWGIRCKVCFDLLTKKVTSSKCTACYGTGFDKGYATPVEIRGRFAAPNSSTDLTPQGLSDTDRIRFICLDYPRIDPGDVIVDKFQNQRFIVQQQSVTELMRNTVHQSIAVSELSKDSIEYRIVINTDVQPMVY